VSGIRTPIAAAIAIAALMSGASAQALTLEQATAQCRRQFAHLSDTEGAPKMQHAIESCAQQKMQQQRSGSGNRR
jgi:hypothetical protein